jgi:hypothetical protein
MPPRRLILPLLLTHTASAGGPPTNSIYATQERVDWDFGNRGLCVIDHNLYCDGFIFNTDMLNAEPSIDPVSEDASGLAYDSITHQRWLGGFSVFADVDVGTLLDNPFNGTQAIAAYDNHQFFLNDGRLGDTHHYDLAIRNGQDGAVTIYTDAFPGADIQSGMSVETGPDGRQVLLLSSGNHVYQYHLSPNWRANATFRLLSVHQLVSDVSLGITGLDYSNGFLYAVFIEGIAEFPYELLPANATCPQDFNNDLELDFFDVSDFLTAYANNDPRADFTNDTTLDFFDLSAFLQQLTAGCP